MIDRVLLKMTCGKTKKEYELVFEKLSGNPYYSFVRPQRVGLVRRQISIFDDDEPDAHRVGEDDTAIVVSSGGESLLPNKEARLGTNVKEDGIDIRKFDFKGCRCPECSVVDFVRPEATHFSFIRCGSCGQYTCSWGVEQRPSGNFFQCQCGGGGYISENLKSLDRSRKESDLDRLTATVGYLPPPDR